MSTNVIQASFAAGEMSPSLFARVDLQKYRVGAARMRNFYVDFRGGAPNRTGTEFIGFTPSTQSQQPRLIPFTFSTTQTYILLFGQLYMRVIMDGGFVLNATTAITGITQASPGVITTGSAHGLSSGNWVDIQDVEGMTEINSSVGKLYIAVVLSATTLSLTDIDGTAINTSSYGAYTAGGTIASVFQLTTPYAAADLPLLKYTQSADTMTLTHPSYVPYDLTRSAHNSWSLTAITFAAVVQKPTNVAAAAVPGGGSALDFYYIVTSITNTTGEESVGSDSGTVANAALNQDTGINNAITWDAPGSGPVPTSYNIYKASPIAAGEEIPTRFGLIGVSTDTTFTDANLAPDFTVSPPINTNPFASNNDPGTANYFQQRKTFAGSDSGPETFWMTKPGNFSNMDVSDPVRDDDAITGTLVSNQVNAIQHLVSVQSGLLAFTSGGIFQISGGTPGAAVTPGTINAQTQSAVGSNSEVTPIQINDHILYVQNKGSVVRDLAYNFYTNIYTGADMSVLSNQLFNNRLVKQWAYAEEPNKLVWGVRDDGILLSFTYLKEQDVYGWARHDTQGLFKSVASITEGPEDSVYFLVNRRLNGTWRYCVERLASRNLGANPALNVPADPAKAWFVDCALQYPLVYPNATLTPDAADGDDVTFTADAAVFTPDTEGCIIRVGGGVATVDTYVSSTEVTASYTIPLTAVLPDVPTDLDPVPIPAIAGDWSCTAPVTTITGLDHLAGMQVAINAGGNVPANQTVASDGSITLDSPCDSVIVGLPYVAQLQTLRLDVGDPTIQGKRKSISAIDCIVNETRGLRYGSTFETLKEFKDGPPPGPGLPLLLRSDIEHFIMDPGWSVDMQVCIEQTYCMPCTVLGVVSEIQVGDT